MNANNNFGMSIEVSREDDLMDTGGGLKKAAWFLKDSEGPPGNKAPFILHNVDVLSTIDLGQMVQFHAETGALATLAVQERKTSRYLLFDEQLQLCGRRTSDQAPELVRPAPQVHAWAFSGIHVISPHLLAMMSEEGAFSIINYFLRLASLGVSILTVL